VDIQIQNYAGIEINELSLIAVSKKVLQHLKPHLPKVKDSLVIVFVNSAKMQSLNASFRQKDYVTDVLSFSGEGTDLGELVFCEAKLREQALANKHSLDQEFLYLLIHGLLHLSGFDHETSDKDAEIMFKIQDNAFETLNTLDTVLF
jgi:probable rRNA maturation factor